MVIDFYEWAFICTRQQKRGAEGGYKGPLLEDRTNEQRELIMLQVVG
jgi:hypothetical protein